MAILIVEDDSYINDLLAEALTREGCSVEQAFSGTEAKLLLQQGSYELVLLDLMLPGMTGEELLSQIRDSGDLPVIVLTAKDGLNDKVSLLTMGADDYVTKPFEIKELLARVSVQLRHAGNLREKGTERLQCKGMTLDVRMHEVTVDGRKLDGVTRQEFAILELLLKNPRRVFSKEEIFEYAWEEQYMGETKTLDVHISNIRKKLRTVTEEEFIETVWGIGYRLHS